VTRADSAGSPKDHKCASRRIEGRHREIIESVSFPRNLNERGKKQNGVF